MAKLAKFLQGVAGVGGAGLNVEDVFSTYLYTGNSSTQTITNGIDLAGEGGLIWIKQRTGANSHYLNDTEMSSSSYYLRSDNPAGLNTGGIALTKNSDGFTIGSTTWDGLNATSNDYLSLSFRRASKFFDVVTYTGTGSNRTISHNLGTTPGMIIVKQLNGSYSWRIWHRSLGNSKYIRFQTDAATTDSSYLHWSSTAHTDTTFSVGTNVGTNESGGTYVAYLFAHNDGDGDFGPDADQDIIKCGSWTASQPSTVTLGFEPQWLLVKRTDGVSNWFLVDNMRGADFSAYKNLSPDLSNAEGTQAGETFTFNPDGFTYNGSVVGGGNTCIYIAIRRGPMAVPESATDVFAMDTLGGTSPNPPSWNSGFPVDMGIYTNKDAAISNFISSRLTGNKYLLTDATNSEVSQAEHTFDYMNGWHNSTTVSSSYPSWMWRRAPNFFDVVAATGGLSGGSLASVPHNLGVTPELIIQKKRSGSSSMDWFVTGSGVGGTDKYLILNSTAAVASTVTLAHDASTFTPIFDQDDFIAYLFASLAGVSKVGSYTGNGSSQTIDCGFSAGARFVLIKKTSGTGSWLVYDTERGIVAGNDSQLYLDGAFAADSYDNIDPDNSGFIATGSTNTSGATYIFYAIA